MEAKPITDPPVAAVEGGGGRAEPTSSGGLFRRPRHPLKPRRPGDEGLPERYSIKEDQQGRYLSCLEAPEVKVRIERGLSLTAGAARKSPEGSIFLDGAAQGEPFMDLEKRIYNLDHHEGCVRHFTLSTCEQALILVARGLDLRERPWTLYANEPDLDTVVAIWVLLNGMHLRDPATPIRAAVVPLVRLEGVIDAHGLDYRDLAGLPEVLTEEVYRKLEVLRRPEREAKEENRWADLDVLDYLASRLSTLDRMVYPLDFFESLRDVEEITKGELSGNRVAVVCRSDSGIYELEGDLKRLYGKRLGVIVQQKDERTYTLRQVDPFLPVNLEAAYHKLNVLDPAVKTGGSANRWGGSGEIGGSPRKTGTALDPSGILEALRLAYRKPSLPERLRAFGVTCLAIGLPLLAAWLAVLRGRLDLGNAPRLFAERQVEFAVVGLLAAVLFLFVVARRRRRRVYGLQRPDGAEWLLALPGALLGALLGGAWIFRGAPSWERFGDGWGPPVWLAMVALPLLAELIFRSLAHGILGHVFRIQLSRGRWYLSWPVGISAILYAAATVPLWAISAAPAPLAWPELAPFLVPAGALILGLSLGVARERASSILAALMLHYLGALAVVLAALVAG